jgi:hypothetical protein
MNLVWVFALSFSFFLFVFGLIISHVFCTYFSFLACSIELFRVCCFCMCIHSPSSRQVLHATLRYHIITEFVFHNALSHGSLMISSINDFPICYVWASHNYHKDVIISLEFIYTVSAECNMVWFSCQCQWGSWLCATGNKYCEASQNQSAMRTANQGFENKIHEKSTISTNTRTRAWRRGPRGVRRRTAWRGRSPQSRMRSRCQWFCHPATTHWHHCVREPFVPCSDRARARNECPRSCCMRSRCRCRCRTRQCPVRRARQ